MLTFKVVNPKDIRFWDELVCAFPEAGPFHSSGWARTLAEAYRYEPHFATWWDGTHLTAVLPAMEVRSFLTGTRGVSLPYTDFCHLLSTEPFSYIDKIQSFLDYGKSRGWKTFETRGADPCQQLPVDCDGLSYLVHILDVTRGEDALLADVRSSTRRSIRKAQKENVQILEENSMKGLSEFVRLNTLTRREHGLPPQPARFFKCLFTHLIKPGSGKIILGVSKGRVIAAAVFLSFNGHAIYKYGASDKRYQASRANNMVMWEAIKTYSKEGAQTFHFGRTEPDNEGLIQFKKGWGGTEQGLTYLMSDFAKGTWDLKTHPVEGFHTRMFSKMPLFALRSIGSVLYRHMG